MQTGQLSVVPGSECGPDASDSELKAAKRSRLERYADLRWESGCKPRAKATGYLTFCIAHLKKRLRKKPLFSHYVILYIPIDCILRFQHRQPDTLVPGAVDTGGFLDTAFWIDQPRFALGQQARPFLEHPLEGLLFGDGFDHFAFAEDYATALAAGKSHVGVA